MLWVSLVSKHKVCANQELLRRLLQTGSRLGAHVPRGPTSATAFSEKGGGVFFWGGEKEIWLDPSRGPWIHHWIQVFFWWEKRHSSRVSWVFGGALHNWVVATQRFCIFTLKIGEDEPILTSIFFRWVETTNYYLGIISI